MIINSINSLLPVKKQTNKNISFAKNPQVESSEDDYKKFTNKSFFISNKQKTYNEILKLMTPSALEQIEYANKFARKFVVYKSDKSKTGLITKDHFYLALLKSTLDYALDIKEGKTSITTETQRVLPEKLAEVTTPRLWERETLDKLIETIQKEIRTKIKELEKNSTKDGFVSSIELSDNFAKSIKQYYELVKMTLKAQNVSLSSLNDTFIYSILKDLKNNPFDSFLHQLSKSVMTKDYNPNDTTLSFYDNLEKKLIKNIDKNYSVYINYSNKDDKAPIYFVNGLYKNIQKEDFFKDCKNLNSKNTQMVVFNDSANFPTIIKELNQMGKNKDKNYIVVLSNYTQITLNSSLGYSQNGTPLISSSEIDAILKYRPKNVHYVFLDDRDNYYTTMNNEYNSEYSNFQPMQIPILDSNAAKVELIKNKEELEKKLGIKLDDGTIEFACSLSNTNLSSVYDKTQEFLKNAALYFKEEPILKKEHLIAYYENSQKEDLNSKDGSYDIIFDTKTSIDDIVGSPMTKTQAQNVAYEIKNFPKTKGYIIYNSTQEGGGRLKCAKAIAGEAKIPMVVINAADFAIRDLDTISKDPMEAIESKIAKLINLMKTQAQTNENKTVMLFISNFDRFASSYFSSTYEQQAFKKLIEEMKKSNIDNSYNIVVVGSCDYPQLIDENIQRPGLFMNEIVIFPPKNKKDIAQIALNHIKKNNYSISGATNAEKNKFLQHFIAVVQGHSYIDIIDILDRANIIAKKNNKDSISKEDINEAYLLKITGPTNNVEVSDKQKELIIRHEGGHALNLQFMYNLLKEQGDDLRIPDSIVNIALDPRGDFLGCVFHKNSDENTQNTNLETIFSNIVCSFGGNSTESHFYNQKGSYGITQDLESANHIAKFAVTHMGLGAHMNYYKPDIDPNTGLAVLTNEDRKNYTKDVKVLLQNAKILSDKIVCCYEDFIKEFSDKFINKFATGDCIITGFEFKKMLSDWEKRQSPKKRKEIYQLKKEALFIIEQTKDSKKYNNIQRINPLYRIN